MISEKRPRSRVQVGVSRALLGAGLFVGIAARPAGAAGLDIVWKHSKFSSRGAIVAFSPDSQMLAVGEANVDLIRIKDGAVVLTINLQLNTGRGQGVGSLAFSPDGQYVATSDLQGNARCWKTDTGKRAFTLIDPAEDVTFSPDNQFFIASSKAGSVQMYRLKDWRTARTIQAGPRNYLTSASVSPDGRVLVSMSRETKLWQTSNGILIRTLKEDRFWGLAFSPDSQLMAAAARDAVWVWRAADGVLLHKLPVQKWTVSCLAFSPDGHTLATGSMANEVGKGHGEISFWSTDSGQLLRTENAGGGVTSIAFSKDNAYLAYGLVTDATAVVARNPYASSGQDVSHR